eukprot:g38569.t1
MEMMLDVLKNSKVDKSPEPDGIYPKGDKGGGCWGLDKDLLSSLATGWSKRPNYMGSTVSRLLVTGCHSHLTSGIQVFCPCLNQAYNEVRSRVALVEPKQGVTEQVIAEQALVNSTVGDTFHHSLMIKSGLKGWGVQTKRHKFKLRGEGFRRELRGKFFSQKVVHAWNELPEEVVEA